MSVWVTISNLLWQIAGLLKDNEKIQCNPTSVPSEDDSEIKKIKKVSVFTMHDKELLRGTLEIQGDLKFLLFHWRYLVPDQSTEQSQQANTQN